jgi:hypothetical protein
VASVRERIYRPSDRRLLAKLVPTFADRGLHVVSVTDLYGRILGFLDRSRYFFFQVAPQLCSEGWVDPVPDPLLLRKPGSAGSRTRTSGSNQELWPLDRRGGLYIRVQKATTTICHRITEIKWILHTSEWPNSKHHWATRQQAIAKTPAKWSAYQTPSVIALFVILIFKV